MQDLEGSSGLYSGPSASLLRLSVVEASECSRLPAASPSSLDCSSLNSTTLV